ncbi:hypothetical protein [Hymenobacter sublimis]|uniref:Uncharacterized protein n=1 Tax=Hymenobacter sublimis TaxID=2933777 RepID=A0ABY4JBJ9_9BACT|nr:hypothetical protein [Hymenobacter sublimis]UPL50196.1 hypothetical protein MWH26_04630 [Hymenobacter sublimis]
MNVKKMTRLPKRLTVFPRRGAEFWDEGQIQSGPLTPARVAEMAQIIQQYKRDHPQVYQAIKEKAQLRAQRVVDGSLEAASATDSADLAS